MLEIGPIERTIVQQALRSGNPLPERIQNAPKLKEELNLYLQAFFDLETERQAGFGPAPIPWSAIANYATFYQFDSEQTEDLFFLIDRMDKAHLKRLRKNEG